VTVIPKVQQGKTALSALNYLYDRAEQETDALPRLIDGDCNGPAMRVHDKSALAEAIQVARKPQGVQPALGRPSKPTGCVVAEGARDDLSAALLKHAGFQQIQDWYGLRHRLPSSTTAADRVASVTHAAEMLRAARYGVELDPALDVSGPTGPSLLESYAAGSELLNVADRIRAAESGAELLPVLDQLLHPQHGALERLREALEAAGEHVTDLDDESFRLADRFGGAVDFVTAAQSDLVGSEAELSRIRVSQPETPARSADSNSRAAALSASPVAT
jgi:hypothetical protein